MDRFTAYRTFVAVVSEGSLIKAAGQLNLTSSAVSKQLSQLEHELGVCLISRTTRSLVVTDEGLEFYRDCQKLLKEVDTVEEKLMRNRGKIVGKIRISWPQILMRSELMPMLAAFAEVYPDIKIESVVSNRKLDFLEDNIDFAFRSFIEGTEPSSLPELISSRSVMCATPDYIERVGYPKSLEDILTANLIIPSYLNLSDLRAMLSVYGEQKHLDRYTSIDDAIAYYYAIKAGTGYGLMQKLLIEDDLKAGKLVEVLEGFKLRNLGIYMIRNEKADITPKEAIFKKFVEEYFGAKR